MAKVQATEITYELHSLGWKAFQDLCITIVSDVLGQTVQSFLSSRDGGRDGAFRGYWNPGEGYEYEGTFTVQCKFSSKKAALAVSDISDELIKARRLASRGLADIYVLMTNLGVSGVTEETIREAFVSLDGVDNFLLFGRDWITRAIRESPRLRMLVPRVYGLGDLGQILDERAYAQAVEIINALGDDLATFVVTEPYTLAAQALMNHGFVLLLGEPAAGKSTIAASLAVGAADLWGCTTVKLTTAEEFVTHWNPHEPRQFFWIDDAFGTTQYQRNRVHDWNQAFPHIRTAIRRGSRVLFTSRDYIYRSARFDLKSSAFPLINESQVVIDVQDLSLAERQQILYNHIKLGKQPRVFKTKIKPFLPEVAENARFLPEIARRLGNPLFTKNLIVRRRSIRRFVEEPIQFLAEVVSNLGEPNRAALALIFMRGGVLESPIELTSEEEKALSLLGVSSRAAREALVALDSSLVALIRRGESPAWIFKHPTVGDAYASFVAEDPELLDIYLSWTSTEKLVSEVTCGDVGLDGVKVVIPPSRYEMFLGRLRELKRPRDIVAFLASRCSPEFLELYLGRHPQLGERIVNPGSYLSAVPETHLLARLHELGMLPEDWRTRFVSHARRLAVETPDVDFLMLGRIRALFKDSDVAHVLGVIREELLPVFPDVIDDWRYNIDPEDDPEEALAPLVEVLEVLRDEFAGDTGAEKLLARAEEQLHRTIQSLHEEWWHPDEEIDYSDARISQDRGAARNVFDDVDSQ